MVRNGSLLRANKVFEPGGTLGVRGSGDLRYEIAGEPADLAFLELGPLLRRNEVANSLYT